MKTETEHNWTPLDELEWTAFQYIANDLSEDQIAAFEAQLAENQDAREAVARCVQLTHAVVSLEEARLTPASVSPFSAKSRRQRRWALSATATAVLAVCGAFWIGTQFSNTEKAGSPGGNQAADLKNLKKQSVGPDQRSTGENTSDIINAWLNIAATAIPETDPAPTAPDVETEGEFAWVVAALDAAPTMGNEGQPNRKERN